MAGERFADSIDAVEEISSLAANLSIGRTVCYAGEPPAESQFGWPSGCHAANDLEIVMSAWGRYCEFKPR